MGGQKFFNQNVTEGQHFLLEKEKREVLLLTFIQMVLRFFANGSSILLTNIFLKIVKLVVLPIHCCSTFAGLHVTAKELGYKVEQRLPSITDDH